jgi:hypothetical protein
VTEVSHLLFARFFDRFSQHMEREAGDAAVAPA